MLSITKLLQTTKALGSLRLAAASIYTSPPVSEGVKAPSRSIEEKLGLPPRPKKPLTPYFRFLQTVRPVVTKENPKLKAVEVVQRCAQKWMETDEATKVKLNDDYQKEKVAYITKRADYEKQLTTEQKENLKIIRKDMVENKQKRIHKKKVRDMERPKKPASGFIRFLAERFKSFEAGKTNYREFQKKIAEDWAKLPEDQKKLYNEACRKESAQYKQDLAKWEMKMIRLGHTDLVRNDTLIETIEKPRASRAKAKKPKADSSDSD